MARMDGDRRDQGYGDDAFVRVDDEGVPRLRGSGFLVCRLWAWHRKGITVAEIRGAYPWMTRCQVLGALTWCYLEPGGREAVEADLARISRPSSAWPPPSARTMSG